MTMQAPLVMAWPATGIVISRNKEVGSVRMDFQNNVVSAWSGGAFNPTTSIFAGCDGVCRGTFEGIGFAFSAEPFPTEQLNLTPPKWLNGSSVPLFDVSFEMS